MRRILIIEDNTEIRENISELLELDNYETFMAGNGEEGLATATEKIPDLILCDIQMPIMNGYELLGKVREDLRLKNIPFVFLTAYSERNEVRKGLEMGANDYLVKPFEPEELLQLMEKYLE